MPSETYIMPHEEYMSKKIVEWPDELSAPVKVEMRGRLICLSPDELKEDEEIVSLMQEIYLYSDDCYYIFTKVNEGFGKELASKLESNGLISKVNERCFYPHPNPGYKNDFVHLPIDIIIYDWHKEAIKKQEHTRFTIELSPWKRKELDITYTANATVQASEEKEPIVEAKPGIMGFNINLLALLEKIKRYWLNRKA